MISKINLLSLEIYKNRKVIVYMFEDYKKELNSLAEIIKLKRRSQKIVFASLCLETLQLIRNLKQLNEDIVVDYIYDDNLSLTGMNVENATVINKNSKDILLNSYIIIANTTFMYVLIENFKKIGIKEESLYFNLKLLVDQYLLESNVDSFEKNLVRNIDKVLYVYENLKDEKSRQSFKNRIRYMINPCSETMIKKNLKNKHDFFSYNNHEVVFDGGAFDGTFMGEFMQKVKSDYSNYYAIEPNLNNFNNLLKTKEDKRNIFFNKGLSNKNTYYELEIGMNQMSIYRETNSTENGLEFCTIDQILKDIPVTLIKLNINGNEMKALKGAERVIKKNYPKLMISCYYHAMDFIEIVYYVSKTYPEYSLFLRDCSDTIYDTVLFCKKD